MTLGSFVFKNALRNKRRALLSVLSMAASLFLLVTLLVALRELTIPPEDIGAAQRIVVRNKISLANLLPARQRPVIERIPGVASVTPFTWFGGQYRDEEATLFAQFAIDPTAFRDLMSEAKLPDDQWMAFTNLQTACLVGADTAEKYGIKVGDPMNLKGTLTPGDLELTVAGIYRGTLDDRNVFFHHKYYDQITGDLGQVGTWWVKAESPQAMTRVIQDINAAFANTSAEVRAETERAFQLSFVSMWGNINTLVHSICSVVVFTLLLVTASTMSMAIRERFRELAILKAVGFRRHELLALILAESFTLSVLGAVLGVGGAWLLYETVDISKMTGGVMIYFEVTPRIMGMTSLIAAAVGVVASVAPSLSVARMSVVEGLKTLD